MLETHSAEKVMGDGVQGACVTHQHLDCWLQVNGNLAGTKEQDGLCAGR